MIGVAVAAAVVSTFGTPFGGNNKYFLDNNLLIGIIFSIEVTATYYMVGTLWKSFFCCTFTLIIFRLFHSL